MDADICLPHILWKNVFISMHNLKHGLLSVVDRCIYQTPSDFKENKIQTDTASIKGYKTMGFFQLYKNTKYAPLYPGNYKTAAVSDQVFGKAFTHIKTLHGFAHHLGKTNNWDGKIENEVNWKNISFRQSCYIETKSIF